MSDVLVRARLDSARVTLPTGVVVAVDDRRITEVSRSDSCRTWTRFALQA